MSEIQKPSPEEQEIVFVHNERPMSTDITNTERSLAIKGAVLAFHGLVYVNHQLERFNDHLEELEKKGRLGQETRNIFLAVGAYKSFETGHEWMGGAMVALLITLVYLTAKGDPYGEENIKLKRDLEYHEWHKVKWEQQAMEKDATINELRNKVRGLQAANTKLKKSRRIDE